MRARNSPTMCGDRSMALTVAPSAAASRLSVPGPAAMSATRAFGGSAASRSASRENASK